MSDPSSPYRIPQRVGQAPSQDQFSMRTVPEFGNLQTPRRPSAYRPPQIWNAPRNQQTAITLNPMAQPFTQRAEVGKLMDPIGTPRSAHHDALSVADLETRYGRAHIDPSTQRSSAGPLPSPHDAGPLPGPTIRPRTPGYVNPNLAAHIQGRMSEATNRLFSQGLISPDVAIEQVQRESSGQRHTSPEPPSFANPYAAMNEKTEIEKMRAREAQAQLNPRQRQMGPGPISPTSNKVWVNPENAERERQMMAAAKASGYHEVSGEPHLYSNVWVNPDYTLRDEWLRVQENLKKTGVFKSPFVPHTYSEYLKHRADMMEAKAREGASNIAKLKAQKEGSQVRIGPAMGGKKFGDNRGAVTSEPTIWVPDRKETQAHPQAKWPIYAEMKEEGDERHTSGFGRFLALPRVPGNDTVGHKMRSLVNTHPLDRVAELQQPAYENDVPEPVDEAEQRFFIGDLLDHIDQFGDDPKPEEEEAKGKEKEREI